MHPLTRDVIYATGLRREIAKPAIACALLFLHSAVPAEDVAKAVDRLREEVTAALRNGGHADAFERLVRLQEHGCSAPDILAKKLLDLGLNPTQIVGLIDEIITYAERLIGASRAKEFHQVLPVLTEAFERMSQSPA